MLIVVDSPDRENQGDIIFPAELANSKKISFLLNNCRGMICVALMKTQATRLDLPLMVPKIQNSEKTGVQFTVTVDAYTVTSFGISSADRAKTIRILARKKAKPSDLVRPGHIFPLLARDGGVLERAGHTEATAALCELAGYSGSGALCELLNESGEPMKLKELKAFSKKNKIKIVSISDLISYVKEKSKQPSLYRSTTRAASAKLPTEYGAFQLYVYKSLLDNREHVVLQMGKRLSQPVLTRIHSQCITGDTFHSLKCDCYAQLQKSLQILSSKKQGILMYLNQEGRGIGLTNKIKAYALQEKGLDTVEANIKLGLPIDARDYEIAADILQDLKVASVILLTNNPEKMRQITKYGVNVVGSQPLETRTRPENKKYLQVKKQKLGHILHHI
ncbi:MAG: GTP cyclohydrolase II [Candidatus Levybacteria bacterium]|nr:GTP cyclohydrolase II [Candidatus Levybacteria bacterium]